MSDKFEKWIEAKKKFTLTDKHVQMARELGLNPKKFGKLNNHKQEPWKAPLKDFIEEIYFKRFKKLEPDNIRPIERIQSEDKRKKEEGRKLREAAKSSLYYIECKKGFEDKGQTWISKIELSKSGETTYFNGHVLKGNGDDLYREIETNVCYRISLVRKEEKERKRIDNGKILIDKDVINEYLDLNGLTELDCDKYEIVEIQKTVKQTHK